jgi:hypothetical protein
MSDNFEYGESDDDAMPRETQAMHDHSVEPMGEPMGEPVIGAAGEPGMTATAESEPESMSEHAPRVARSASSQFGMAAERPSNPESVASPAAGVSGMGTTPRRPVRRGAPRARRMNLSLTHCDAWSVAKVTFLLGVAGAIIQIVAAALIWILLNVVGVFDQVTQIVSSTGLDAGGFNLADVFSLSMVLSAVTIFSIVEVVLITLLAIILAWLYNVISSLVGGVHITLGDD